MQKTFKILILFPPQMNQELHLYCLGPIHGLRFNGTSQLKCHKVSFLQEMVTTLYCKEYKVGEEKRMSKVAITLFMDEPLSGLNLIW